MSLVGQNGDLAAKSSSNISGPRLTTSDTNKGTKRPADDDANPEEAKKQETEAQAFRPQFWTITEEQKPEFRLNPPTLIHGVAKSAPKIDEEEDTSEVQEKPFLRPSLLKNHTGFSNPFLADSTSEDAFNDKKSEEALSETENSSESKPRLNFLKLSSGETDREVGFGVFGTFTDSHLHKVDFSSGKKDITKQDGATPQNYFLQFSNTTDSNGKDETSAGDSKEVTSTSTSLVTSRKSDFVFGQNMDSRVTSPPKQEGELQAAAQYVFGENLSDRVKKEEDEEEEAKPNVETSPEQSGKSLIESAEEMEKAKENKRVKFEEVQVFTGEEGEENVVQAPCKLHIFQKDKQIWEERGRGLLRLNDKTASDDVSHLESRIILRAQGSLRVLLNAKVWPGMIVEKVNSKNIRISAIDGETGNIKIYLITATPNDADHIYQGLDYRVQALKTNTSYKEEVDESTVDSAPVVSGDSWLSKEEEEEDDGSNEQEET